MPAHYWGSSEKILHRQKLSCDVLILKYQL